MKPYTIKKIEDKFIVIGLSCERIESYFGEISSALSQKKFDGTIIFDLLLSNGNTSRRFFSAQFSETRILPKTVKKLASVEPKIKDYTIGFFLKHKKLLQNGILTSSEIERILEQDSVNQECVF